MRYPIRCVGRGLAWLACCMLLVACTQSPLLERLDERQANEVVAVLLRHNIPAEKHNLGKSGFVVRVASSDLPEAIELVQREDLPSASRLQVSQAFPADAMVNTPTSERARLLSAIEQRLEESLAVIEGVKTARVHVSYDATASSSRLQPREPAMHVAAVVVHEAGVDTQVLLQSVKRFLRNAFVQVDYDNVSVILSEAAPPRRLNATQADRQVASDVWLWLGVALLVLGLLVGIAVVYWRKAASAAAKERWRGRWARATRSKAKEASAHAD
ncbi:MAG TPA: type III secretion inner membrane ring lipoprotein SctJ [Dyella sp.]|uniref:type III secretion system inner membrane ring lipoprotein SctJ n=1 Tax=Dyella sp. TaxID=1869338 RepID=UPI002F93D2FF